jgi:hypothetical protein
MSVAKLSDAERTARLELLLQETLKRQADLERRVAVLELYVDSERRERARWTLDDLQNAWRKDAGIARPPVPPYGPV